MTPPTPLQHWILPFIWHITDVDTQNISRALSSCLESQRCNIPQKKHVSVLLCGNIVQLINSYSIMELHWTFYLNIRYSPIVTKWRRFAWNICTFIKNHIFCRWGFTPLTAVAALSLFEDDATSLACISLSSLSHLSLQNLSASIRVGEEHQCTAIFRSLRDVQLASSLGSGHKQRHPFSFSCPSA